MQLLKIGIPTFWISLCIFSAKERFMDHGFSWKEGIDYEEFFSLVARYNSIRLVLALAAVMRWKIHQMDVKTDFLNGVVEEEVCGETARF